MTDRSKSLFIPHLAALTKKRFLTFKRDKKMWAFVVLMPAVFVVVGILIMQSVQSYSEPSLLLTPAVSCLVLCFVKMRVGGAGTRERGGGEGREFLVRRGRGEGGEEGEGGRGGGRGRQCERGKGEEKDGV